MYLKFLEIALFLRQRTNKKSASAKPLNELSAMMSASQLLADHKRQTLLRQMRDHSDLEAARYDHLCFILIEHLANYCQHLPESANSYYAQAGGLVDHALNRTEAALGLFKEVVIQEDNKELSEEQLLWQYALYSAAVLQGIGKLFVDFQVDVFDSTGLRVKPWNPLLGDLLSVGSYYDYDFLKESDVDLRRRLNILLAKELMPAEGFAWIASNPQVLTVWLALLHEDFRGAGTLGAILIRADALAIQRYLAAFLARIGARAGGALGRAGTFSGGVPETIQEKEFAIGVEFVYWLMSALEKGLIMINKAPLLMVPGGFLMCPEMYRLFVREHPEYKNWQAIEKAMLSLNLHEVDADGSMEVRFEQKETGNIFTGIVLPNYALFLPSMVNVSQPATGSTQKMSALHFIHATQEHHQLVQHGQTGSSSFAKLTVSGLWANAEQNFSAAAPGAKQGG